MLWVILLVSLLVGVMLYARSSPLEMPTQTPAISITARPTQDIILGREPMRYPANYRENLVHYLTVDRADGITRNIYISAAAVQAVLNGEMIPYGTITVIEPFDAARDSQGNISRDTRGRLVADQLRADEIHVGERRSTWLIEDTHANTNFEGWNFRAFAFDTGEPIDRDLNECFNCHDSAFNTEFVFTRDELLTYAQTGEIQYFYCGLTGRNPCR